MNDWKVWAHLLSQNSPSNFYSGGFFSDYFPGYLYMLWISGLIFKFLSVPINSLPFEIFLKSITSLFDIGTAIYIYKIISNYNRNWRFLAPVLYLINPAVVFNTSIWGQIDGIMTFFLVYSAYLLIEIKKNKWSLFYSLGILIKPQSLAIAPLLFLRSSIKQIIIIPVLLSILSIPFFGNNLLGLYELGLKSAEVYPVNSAFAFNFWSLFGWWRPDNISLVFTYKIWGLILFIILALTIIYPIFKKKLNKKEFYLATSLLIFSFFLFLTRMHERYLFPFFAFFLIAALIKKTAREAKLLLGFYFLISMIHFLNLWFVYYYYNFVYNNPKFATNLLYVLLNNNFKFFSALMVILFGILLLFHYEPYAKK